MIRTLICEHLRLPRAGLVALLSRPSDIEVVAELDGIDEIVPTAIVTRADVAVVDLDMPGGPGALVRIRDAVPGCRVLALFQPGNRGRARCAVTTAHGLLPKSASPDRMVSAVRRVAAGHRVIDPALARWPAGAAASPLTPREATVLRLVAEGMSAAEMAERLNLAPGTVRNYISRAMAKTGAVNRHDAVRLADGQGWLPPARRPDRGHNR